MAERFCMSGRFFVSIALALSLVAAADASAQSRRRPGDPPAPEKAEPAKPRMSREEALDDLFARLKAAPDEEEAKGVAGAIERVFMQSGSDTIDLLMGRAVKALQADKKDIAEEVLDRIVAIEPDWAEGWNKRATIRFMRDDYAGALEDIAQALKREPRHFGAMAGMGLLLEKMDRKQAALRVFRKALEIHPQLDVAKKLVEKLAVEVEGRDI